MVHGLDDSSDEPRVLEVEPDTDAKSVLQLRFPLLLGRIRLDLHQTPTGYPPALGATRTVQILQSRFCYTQCPIRCCGIPTVGKGALWLQCAAHHGHPIICISERN